MYQTLPSSHSWHFCCFKYIQIYANRNVMNQFSIHEFEADTELQKGCATIHFDWITMRTHIGTFLFMHHQNLLNSVISSRLSCDFMDFFLDFFFEKQKFFPIKYHWRWDINIHSSIVVRQHKRNVHASFDMNFILWNGEEIRREIILCAVFAIISSRILDFVIINKINLDGNAK